MLNQKSNNTSRVLITKADLAPQKYTVNANADTFPPLTLIRSGNQVQAIFNGTQTADLASNVFKEYPLPTDCIPVASFTGMFDTTFGKTFQYEFNQQTFKIRGVGASSKGDWVSASVTYISRILGGGVLNLYRNLGLSCRRLVTA